MRKRADCIKQRDGATCPVTNVVSSRLVPGKQRRLTRNDDSGCSTNRPLAARPAQRQIPPGNPGWAASTNPLSRPAEIVRPALLCAPTVLRTITENADDSPGVIGGECERAADLFAQACRLGAPDPVELAEWLATFRATVAGLAEAAARRFQRRIRRPCLSEGDLGAAWEAADRYGPGWAWQGLATQGAEARPVAAADLYRQQLENDPQRPNTRLYPGIAATLASMAKLYERGGCSADFALYIGKVRRDYGRRRSLMKALNAKGL